MTRAAAIVVPLLLSLGCASAPHYRRAPVEGPESAEWLRIRGDGSRRATLYDGFDHRATASATWLSPAVREAAVRRQASWQGRSATETEQAVARGRAEAARGEEFLLAIYTAERRANDLDAPASIWHLELDDGDTRVPASEITAVAADATVRQLYAYVGPFDQVYRVRFRWTGAPLATRPFTLRISGGLGALLLDFGPDGQRTLLPRPSP